MEVYRYKKWDLCRRSNELNMIVNDLSKLKDIECYSYCDDGKGNIEIMFRISDEEQYRLVVTEKDLKSMCRFSKLVKLMEEK